VFTHIPGLKVVVPATPYDAKGLLIAAIRDNDPVMFFEHKALYDMTGPVPEESYTLPFGEANVVREGSDVTIVTLGRMVHTSLAAADELAAEGIGVTVVDPRTITPLDEATILAEVAATGKALLVQEGVRTGGFVAEIAARIAESGTFHALEAPVVRLCGLDVPMPYAPELEKAAVPQVPDIVAAARQLYKGV
jgi:pyruvate dehydrogenase E1 component beta subunit